MLRLRTHERKPSLRGNYDRREFNVQERMPSVFEAFGFDTCGIVSVDSIVTRTAKRNTLCFSQLYTKWIHKYFKYDYA